MSQTHFYCARVILEAIQNDDQATLFEDRFILIQASDEADAIKRSSDVASQLGAEYQSASGRQVTWRLRRLLDVQEVLQPLGDGVEVYRQFIGRGELQQIEEIYSSKL